MCLCVPVCACVCVRVRVCVCVGALALVTKARRGLTLTMGGCGTCLSVCLVSQRVCMSGGVEGGAGDQVWRRDIQLGVYGLLATRVVGVDNHA